MASSMSGPSSSGPAASGTSSDWPKQAADFIEQKVGVVRNLTTVKALLVVRALVYGTLAVFLLLMLTVLFAIAAVRFADVWLPGNVWQAHLVVGVIFLVIGALAWSRRRAPQEA